MPHKIFVHSKARVNPAQSTHSDFSFQLSAPIDVPHSRAYVDQVHLPNEFQTISAHNKYIYVEEIVGATVTKRKIALFEGMYDATTLPIHLASVLNTGTTMSVDSYSVSYSDLSGRMTVATSDAVNTFFIWTREYLEQGLWNATNDPTIPSYSIFEDAYDVLGFHHPTAMIGSQGDPAVGSAHINVIPYHTLYIHSSLGTQGDSVGPMGSSSVIRTVCLDQPPGRYVHDRNSSPYDYISVAKGQLRQLDIRLTDWRGRAVPLTNSWSFSLILVPLDDV
jgi:hypothetical protein